jgi:hypothetical protein
LAHGGNHSGMTTRKLKMLLWVLTGLSFTLVVAQAFLRPTGGWGVLWFFSFVLVAIPAGMLGLHLGMYPAWIVRVFGRPKR